MSDPNDNLTSGRYKTCGWGKPICDQDGHYDEVGCGLTEDYMCGDGKCPLDIPCDPPDDYDPNDPDHERDQNPKG